MTFPQQYKSELLKAIETIELDKVNQAIELFRDARANGRHIFVCGNGGSASTAPHMGRIEDAHMIVCHMIGYYFMEEAVSKEAISGQRSAVSPESCQDAAES